MKYPELYPAKAREFVILKLGESGGDFPDNSLVQKERYVYAGRLTVGDLGDCLFAYKGQIVLSGSGVRGTTVDIVFDEIEVDTAFQCCFIGERISFKNSIE